MITIEIDGKKLEVEPGKMIIQVADDAGIVIPRFCYHKKLSVAANCRMCLVEIENGRKPMPACATPVAEGMKVFTKSDGARAAQKHVMEFLLINHPLDCPICDQGGECELQDLSMAYGQDVSRYSDSKRAVGSDDLGSLISTDMTRCIHCTRCVRFGQEVAGVSEIGLTGRGESVQIGTYIKHSLTSELSGNIIDVCPVGALTSKPARYRARAWEMQQSSSISPHDCLGSNLYYHTRRKEVIRVVPQENESINEVWLSDRDRFSYCALASDERLLTPRVKVDGKWIDTEWEPALELVADKLLGMRERTPEAISAFVSPNSTTEELYLLQKIVRGLGSDHIEHRLREVDFSDQVAMPAFPGLAIKTSDIENQNAVFLVGCNVRHEQPIISLKLRKAVLKGAKVMTLDCVKQDLNFDATEQVAVRPDALLHELAGIVKTLAETAGHIPSDAEQFLKSVTVTDTQRAIADALQLGEQSLILIGATGRHHPQAADIRALAHWIAELSGSSTGCLTDGANSAGAWLAGAVPHRTAAGVETKHVHAHTTDKPRAASILMNIDPSLDCANPAQTMEALKSSDFVVALSPFFSEDLASVADVILPIAATAETSGTFVNWEGVWQGFTAAIPAPGQARPGWKLLRVLANYLDLPGFEYISSTEVRDELAADVNAMADKTECAWQCPKKLAPIDEKTLIRITQWSLYQSDQLVRRSEPLQTCAASAVPCVQLNHDTAVSLSLTEGQQVLASQEGASAELLLVIDDRVPANCVVIPAGFSQTATLGKSFAPIEITAC